MHRARFRRRITAAVLLVAISILGVLGFLLPVSGEEPEATTERAGGEERYAFPVRTSRALHGRLVHWVHANGRTRPVRTLTMTSRIAGVVRSVRIYEGMSVRQGDTLVLIEDGEFRLAQERARVGLLGAQIEYRTLARSPYFSRADSARQGVEAEALVQRLEAISSPRGGEVRDDRELLREQRELSAALAYATLRREDVLAHRSGLAMAQEAAEHAHRDLEATVVRAPFDGEIADCPLTACSAVVPGQRLLTLLDLSTPVVEADVLEHDIAMIRTGQEAGVRLVSLPAREWSGSVTACNPLTDPASGAYRVTVTMNGGAWPVPRPGMLATVRIATATESDTVIVPRSAVVYRDERPVVFTVREGRAQWRYVLTGPSNGEEVAILDGITAGEEVITDGHFVIAHDARVTVIR